eukprot:scpid97499/ scgid19692/ 
MAQSSPTGVDGSPNLKHPPKKNSVESVTLDEDGSLVVRIRIHVPSTPSSTRATGIEGDLAALNMKDGATTQNPVGQTPATPTRAAGPEAKPDSAKLRAMGDMTQVEVMSMSVKELPGIGKAYEGWLNKENIEKVSQILEIYTETKGIKTNFQERMHQICGQTDNYAGDCYEAIHRFYHNHKDTLPSITDKACVKSDSLK